MRTATGSVAVLAALVLTACGSGSGPAAAPSSSATAVPVPTPSAPVEPPSTSPSPAAGSTARAVYWIGADDPRGPRLYREFAPRPESADAVADAVALMLGGEPVDADYASLWDAGTRLLGVERDGTTALVDLSQEATVNGGGSAFEAATLQQLVHTVTAADPSLSDVQLLVEGEPVQTLWGSVDTSEPLRRDPAAQVLAPVWLDVAEGAIVDGSFGGTATVFEATVSWELRRAGAVVDEGFSTASTGAPERGTWSATTDLPAGQYELRAWESSAQDGSVTWLDTKTVTIAR